MLAKIRKSYKLGYFPFWPCRLDLAIQNLKKKKKIPCHYTIRSVNEKNL